MKSAFKFLQSSQKLEQRQIARRAQDVDDIQAFDEQKEAQKTKRFHKQVVFERHVQVQQAERFSQPEFEDDDRIRYATAVLDNPTFEENDWSELKQREFDDIMRLETQAAAVKIAASDDEIDGLKSLQEGQRREQERQELRQLAAAQDVFATEFSDVTEAEMRREMLENQRAIQERAPRLDLTPKQNAVAPMTPELPEDVEEFFVEDEPPQEEPQAIALPEPENTPPKKKTETVFYFRSTPNMK